MLNLLIADDELYVREYMKSVLEWEKLGIRISGCARDSEEALEMARADRPDLALLDINMPGADGLMLTETLKRENPDLVIGFVTGYSEFEYARKALQLGAEEYILKPFSPEELEAAVCRLKMKIQKRAQERHASMEENRVLKENLLRQLLIPKSDLREEQLKVRLKRRGISLPYECFLVVKLDIHFMDPSQENDTELWKFSIRNILEEYQTASGTVQQILDGEEKKTILILNGSRESMEKEKLRQHFGELQKMLWEYLKLYVMAGIGEIKNGLSSLYDSACEADIACQEQYIQGAPEVLFYSEVRTTGFYRLDMNARILEILRRKDKTLLRKELENVVLDMRREQYSYDYSYMIFGGILSIGLSFLSDMNANITEVLGKDFSPYRELGKCKSAEECKEWLLKILEKIVDEFSRTRSRRADEIIQEVEKCVREQYGDYTLTVEKIAESVYLDASYIRRIFSKYMGCTIVDYLTEYRMNRAKKLLETGDMPVSLVAEKVGYMDPGYFSKCFKKYYGVTPSNYPVFSHS